MKFHWILLLVLVASLASSGARHVSKRSSEKEKGDVVGYLVVATDRQGLPVAENIEAIPEAVALREDSSNGQQDPAEVRGPFDDFVPYVSNFIYRDSVKKWLVKPMIKGTQRLVPSSAISYYKTSLARRRFFKLISPLYPAVSSYTSKKFEQGVFWTLNRGYRLMRDALFEFDE